MFVNSSVERAVGIMGCSVWAGTWVEAGSGMVVGVGVGVDVGSAVGTGACPPHAERRKTMTRIGGRFFIWFLLVS
jgi:hypothetical protein